MRTLKNITYLRLLPLALRALLLMYSYLPNLDIFFKNKVTKTMHCFPCAQVTAMH